MSEQSLLDIAEGRKKRHSYFKVWSEPSMLSLSLLDPLHLRSFSSASENTALAAVRPEVILQCPNRNLFL